MKKSAGILVYRKNNNQIQVLLAHMGGPYWEKKDIGAWSIPKGEYETETPMMAAIREFREETGLEINNPLQFLKTVKQNSNKLLTVFSCEQDFDISHFISNTFLLEWPPKSNQIKSFPEMDKLEWFSMKEAKTKIVKGQVPFLEKLESIL